MASTMTPEELAAATAVVSGDTATKTAANDAAMRDPNYWEGMKARARALPAKLLAGGSAGLNTMFYGIPDVFLKTFHSDAYKNLQDIRAANPGATSLGTGAGLALGLGTGATEAKGAGMVSGGLLRGAGSLAEGAGLKTIGGALGKAGDFLATGGAKLGDTLGTKILKGAGQGAGLAAEQNIVPVIGGTVTPGEAAAGVGLGTVAGGAIPVVQKLGGALARSTGFGNASFKYTPIESGKAATSTIGANIDGIDYADPLSKKQIDNILSSLGIRLKDIRQTAGGGLSGSAKIGSMGSNAEDTKKGIVDFLLRQAKANDGKMPRNSDEIQSLLDSVRDRWQALMPAAEEAGVSATAPAIRSEIEALPEVLALKAGTGGEKMYSSLMANIDNAPDLPAQRAVLRNAIQRTMQPGPSLNIENQASAAHAIDEVLGRKIGEIDPSWQQMKQDWHDLQGLRYAQARNMATIGKLEAGSPTAARTEIGKMMGLGVGATGGVGGAAAEFDPNDQSTWLPAAAILAGSTVAGTIAGKAATGAFSMAAGDLSKLIYQAMENPKIQAFMEKVQPALKKVFASPQSFIDRYASMVPAAGGGIPNVSPEAAQRVIERDSVDNAANPGAGEFFKNLTAGRTDMNVPSTTPATTPTSTTPATTPTTAIGPPAPAGSEPVSTTPQASQVQAQEAATPEPVKQEAVWTTNKKYQSALEKRLQTIYGSNDNIASAYTYDEFKQKLASGTDNFNPLKVSKILFSNAADQKAYLKDYNTALQMGEINPSKAYDTWKGTQGLLAGIGGDTFDPTRRIKQKGYNNLIDIIAAQVSGPDKLPSKQILSKVKADVDSIMKLPISAEKKNQELYKMMATSYGLGQAQLQNLGLMD